MENVPVPKSNNSVSGSYFNRAASWALRAWPFLIAQVDEWSARHAEHRGRVSAAEAAAQLFLEQGKVAAQVKADLLKQIPSADGITRAQLQMLLRNVDAEIQTLSVLTRATTYLKGPDAESPIPDPNAERAVHWTDKFLELCRTKNEDWRRDLLARALALESEHADSISLKALWAIGMMSENEFHSFAHILDIVPRIGGEPYMSVDVNKFLVMNVPDCMVPGQQRYGNLVVILHQAGLITVDESHKKLETGAKGSISYCGESLAYECSREMELHGGFCTQVGLELCALYKPNPTAIGQELFSDLASDFKRMGATVSPSITSEA